MRNTIVVLTAAGVLLLAAGSAPALAQMGMSGSPRPLGGYGAATISSYYGGLGGGYLPYSGGGSGFMPYRGGPGAGMGAQPIPRRLPETPIGGTMMAATPIGGASIAGAMGGGRGGLGPTMRTGTRAFFPFGYEGGVGMGDMGRPWMEPGRTRRAPSGPGFGSPFRMPPGLTGSSSMAMP